jgi:hypothetical protein
MACDFDSEILHIIGNAMDEAWRQAKFNHLKEDASAARSVLASHIFAMARQGVSSTVMRLTL